LVSFFIEILIPGLAPVAHLVFIHSAALGWGYSGYDMK